MLHRLFLLCLLGSEYFFCCMASLEPNLELSTQTESLIMENIAPQMNTNDRVNGEEAPAVIPQAMAVGDPLSHDDKDIRRDHGSAEPQPLDRRRLLRRDHGSAEPQPLDRRGLLRSQLIPNRGTDLFLPKGLADLLGSPQVGVTQLIKVISQYVAHDNLVQCTCR